jgi:hypothetical protein
MGQALPPVSAVTREDSNLSLLPKQAGGLSPHRRVFIRQDECSVPQLSGSDEHGNFQYSHFQTMESLIEF